MRTTIAIDEQLLKAAQRRAAQRGLTLGQLIEEALRADLAAAPGGRARPPIPVFTGGNGLRAGVDPNSNQALLEAIDDGLPSEHLR